MYFRADGVDDGGCETGCPLTMIIKEEKEPSIREGGMKNRK
jgi:hypothetical protein